MENRACDQSRRAARKGKTLFCQLTCEGASYPAVVLNISSSGLFVRTAASLTSSSDVEVGLRLAGGESWVLRAEIMRRPRQGDRMLKRGLGLRLIDPPDGFAEFVEAL
jgi:hypothetical protein